MYYQNLFNQDYINQGKYEQYKTLKKDIALIKNKRVSVSNDDKMSPGTVVKLVNSKVNFEFKMHHHTYCWKYYKVRPKTKSDNPEETDSRYCNYDSVNNDYVYTKQWVNKLVKDLSNEEIREKIFESRGQRYNII